MTGANMRANITPLLYLDFDGVLHPTSAPLGESFRLAICLAETLDASGACDVIISSSWRHYYTNVELLSYLPPSLAKRVRGVTGDAVIGRHARHQEIQAHARTFGVTHFKQYRALDDCAWEFPQGVPYLIACNPNTGIGPHQLLTLQTWLSKASS